MSSLEKKVEVLQRRSERDKRARQLAEDKLEKYSRDIYQVNLDLSSSLQTAQKRQEELEFLNDLTEQIVREDLSESLFANTLPILSRFIGARLGFILASVDGLFTPAPITVWTHHSLDEDAVADIPAAIECVIEQDANSTDAWRLANYEFVGQIGPPGFLTVNIDTVELNAFKLCFNVSETQLTADFLSVLITARDVLSSGLKRRQYQRNIVERNKQLQESITHLERAQSQLIHSEKMASLGQLAAGVAHEINNPIGFIKSNSDVLSAYISDFERFIKRVQSHISEHKLSSEVFTRLIEEFELDYILPDMHEIVEANQDGIGRIRGIVSSLSTFSHPGEEEKAQVCLVDCVNRSLKLVANELKYKHEVVNELPETLPHILANFSQLQQVFVILMINAVHAMPDGGTLTIKHRIDERHITLTIADSGCGIKPENLKQIFTPFFTTKPVGSGTGLGLSICHTILDAHSAKVNVESAVGEGTQFHLAFQLV